MKNQKLFDNLIKIHENEIKRILTQINYLDDSMSNVRENILKLKQEQQYEIDKFAQDYNYSKVLNDYIAVVEKKINGFESVLKNLQKQKEIMDEQLFNEFSILKKYELLKSNRFAKEKKRIEMIDGKFLDELSITNAKRNNSL